MDFISANHNVIIYPDERIDSYNAGDTEKAITEYLENSAPEKIIIDCKNLEYIASAGLRILLKVGKTADLSLINVSKSVYETLELTGFTKMFETRKQMREISVSGCNIVGVGFSSKVYRYDDETAVKLFNEKVTLDRIYSETESARKSFVAGIPTAIPFDIVKCGKQYGTIFELIDADNLSAEFMYHPEIFDELMDKYVELLKKFHNTPALPGAFPDIKEKYKTWASGLCKYLEKEEIDKIYKLIDAIPSRSTMIHVDCHAGNIMVQRGRLIFVDMADVSIGHPLVDIGTEYLHYVLFRETSLGAKIIFGIEPEDETLPLKVWKELVDRYFADCDKEEMDDINEMLKYFGYLRCLIFISKHAHIEKEQAEELISKARKELMPNIEKAQKLFASADKYFK